MLLLTLFLLLFPVGGLLAYHEDRPPPLLSGVISFWWASPGYSDQMSSFWEVESTVIDLSNWWFRTWTRDSPEPGRSFYFTWNSTNGNFTLEFPGRFIIISPPQQHQIYTKHLVGYKEKFIGVRFPELVPACNNRRQPLFWSNRTELTILI